MRKVLVLIVVCSAFLLLGAAAPARAASHAPVCSQHARLHEAVRCGSWQVTLNRFSVQAGELLVNVTIKNTSTHLADLLWPALSVTPSAGVPSHVIALIPFAAHQSRTVSVTLPIPPGVHHVTLHFHAIAWQLHL